MSGLDKMKARILEDAKCVAAEITGKAETEAQTAVQTARETAEAEAEQIIRQAEYKADDYARKVKSSMDMRRKQAVLAAKQEVISEILNDAYSAVMNLDNGKYFELLEKLLENHVLSGDGTISFSAEDLARMPESFAVKINQAAASKGGSLRISDQPEKIDGGFLLTYGGVEENCTIRAVFESKREELSDCVNRLLFG